PFAPRTLGLSTFASTYLPADICTRWLAMLGCEASHITATDVHSIQASADGVTRNTDLCAASHESNRRAFARMGIDCAVHETTDHPRHLEVVNGVLRRLADRGCIVRRATTVIRCSRCGVYLPRRFVSHTSPRTNARWTIDTERSDGD